MQRINDVISPELIKLSLNGKNKVEVIEELTDLLFRNKLTSRADYIAMVYKRESTLSTYCGYEVAIPHAISSAVKTPAVCFGRSEGFNWDHQSDEWVRFVFLFAIPEKKTGCGGPHLYHFLYSAQQPGYRNTPGVAERNK